MLSLRCPAMGHNVSDRKRHDRILGSPLAGWTGWRLMVDCGSASCARGRTYSIEALAGFYPGATVAACCARLKCSLCGGGAALLELRRPRRGLADEVLVLRGRGAAG